MFVVGVCGIFDYIVVSVLCMYNHIAIIYFSFVLFSLPRKSKVA